MLTKPTALAWGKPFLSSLVGEFYYFLDPHTPEKTSEPNTGDVDLCRVPRAGGEAELIADDLDDFRYPKVLRHGNDLILKTRKRGIRAFSVSGNSIVARDLVAGAGRTWYSIDSVALAGETVVYVFGSERSKEVRAVSLGGGSSWQLAPPYRDPYALVADDRGVYWINLVEARHDWNVDGVFACDMAVN